ASWNKLPPGSRLRFEYQVSMENAGMKNKPRFWLYWFILSIFVLVQCSPVTPAPVKLAATATSVAPTKLQVEVKPEGPTLVGQNPPEGQRLELLPSLEFTFDRDMDQAKTSDAFTLLDPENKPVAGKATWADSKTFSFKPDSKLAPSTSYKAIFSTVAAGKDGKPLSEEISRDLTT